MFETFNVPCFLSKPHNCFIIAASGSTSGLSVDFGEDGVNIVPIYECMFDPPWLNWRITYHMYSVSMVDWARTDLRVGGRDLIDFEMKLLTARGYSFTTTAERGSFCILRLPDRPQFDALYLSFRDCSRYYAKVGLSRTLFWWRNGYLWDFIMRCQRIWDAWWDCDFCCQWKVQVLSFFFQ